MATVDFYSNLHYDFSDYENDDELIGLTTAGFGGSNHLKINEFNMLELKAACDVIACYFRPIESINNRRNSYGLKHIIERYLNKETNGVINYVSNGTLILAMYDARYKIKRSNLNHPSPNCSFNVSEKSIKSLIKINEGR